jgi:hypothetical protein
MVWHINVIYIYSQFRLLSKKRADRTNNIHNNSGNISQRDFVYYVDLCF